MELQLCTLRLHFDLACQSPAAGQPQLQQPPQPFWSHRRPSFQNQSLIQAQVTRVCADVDFNPPPTEQPLDTSTLEVHTRSRRQQDVPKARKRSTGKAATAPGALTCPGLRPLSQ